MSPILLSFDDFDFFSDNINEAVVVTDGGESGGVGGEGDGGQFHAFFFKTAGQFGGEVLRVGRRATIAADEDFTVVHQAFDQHHGGFGRRFGQHFDGLPFGGDAFFEMGAYAFLKGASSSLTNTLLPSFTRKSACF